VCVTVNCKNVEIVIGVIFVYRMNFKWSINPIIQTPVYSHTYA
jgi:hypothetical protein